MGLLLLHWIKQFAFYTVVADKFDVIVSAAFSPICSWVRIGQIFTAMWLICVVKRLQATIFHLTSLILTGLQ